MDAQAAPASVLQLSIFTSAKVQSIPRPERRTDFPVQVTLVAPGEDQTVRAAIDVVAAVDVSGSINGGDRKLGREKAAVELLIQALLPGDRLAVVPFNHDVDKPAEELVVMSEKGKEAMRSKVRSLTAHGGTRLSKPLERAEQILTAHHDVDRAAFIILLSDGQDSSILKEKEWARTSSSTLKKPEYAVHTFGFNGHRVDTMEYIAGRTNGAYCAIHGDHDESLRSFASAVAALLTNATSRLFSVAGIVAELTAVHPGVSISRVDAGERKAGIGGGGARSGAVDIGAMRAGETAEFVVYLDVPEGDAESETTEVMSVGGAYLQSWDGKRVELERSVVSVDRPVPPPPPQPCCAELDMVEYRLEYWCEVKWSLTEMYGRAEAEVVGGGECRCQCQVAAVLREASLRCINGAMHGDIYDTVVQALKLRRRSTGGDGVNTTDVHGDPANGKKIISLP